MCKKYGNYTSKEAIELVKYEFGLTTKQDAHATFYECNNG